MCGNSLSGKPAADPEYALRNAPGNSHARLQDVAPQQVRREPAEPPRVTPMRPSEPEPVANRNRNPEPAPLEPKQSGKWWVDEGDTTVGGPSFLGLSSAQSGGSGYSYLFQEEEERSHAGGWVLLALLLVLGGVVYFKWQPIRDFVLTTAISHAQQRSARQDNSNPPASLPASSQPATTVASSDPQSPPAITTESNPNQKPPDSSKAEPPQGGPEPATESGKAGAQPSEKQADEPQADEKRVSARDEDPADEDTRVADEKPSSSKARAAAANEGSELVTSGEKYLYGRGVARSCDQAVTYFHAAAQKQNPQAFSHLGALYATGECVPMDRAVAYAWFRRAYAKEPSNHYFEQNLTMLWREMTPQERQRALGTP